MSDDERMDRAERIKQLREGRRTESAEEGAGETPGAAPDEPESGDAATTADDTDSGDAPPADDGTDGSPDVEASTDDGSVDDESATADGDDAAGTAELDDAVLEAVERVSDASASVPSPEEMGSAGDASGDAEPADDQAVPTDGDVPGDASPNAPGGTEAADDQLDDQPDDVIGPGAEPAVGHRATADTRVLEFTLGDERYCIDIEYVEEIVKDETITRVPNTPEFVEGVVDLRGQITTLLNPKLLLSTEETEPGELLVVFDSEAFDDQGHLGWIVDDVRQVAPVADEQVDEPPVQEDYVNGVIDRGDDEPFVVWTSPEDAIESAT